MITRNKFLLLLILMLSLLLTACGPGTKTYIKDGKEYGVTSGAFRARWWNYYERGLSFAQGEFWPEAAEDFKEALKRREEDQRRARTYGMHFVDYFGHRELGVAYYHLQKYPQAIQELEASLQTVDTAKAKFYLNKSREVLLKVTKADPGAPQIEISAPADGALTNQSLVMVTGQVKGEGLIASIEINGQPLYLELAEKVQPFKQALALKPGPNEITVKTKDLLERKNEKTLKVTLDKEGPLVEIFKPEPGEAVKEKKLRVTGMLSDPAGIVKFTLQGKEVPVTRGTEVKFDYEVELEPGQNQIVFVAQDQAGNVTSDALQLGSAGLAGWIFYGAVPATWPQVALGGASWRDISFPMVAAAPPPPLALRLKDLADKQTVYFDAVYIEGSAQSQQEITKLTINGIPIGQRRGKLLFFSYKADLKEGDNNFLLVAEDRNQKKAEKNITITRQLQKALAVGSRMSLSLLPFERKGEKSAAGEMAYDYLLQAFFEQQRFNLVERAKLEAILQEQKLSQEQLVDKDTAVRLGKMLAAEGMVAGTISESKGHIEIVARIIDVETSEIIEVADVYQEDKSPATVRLICEGLALKFRNKFPLLEGYVVKAEPKLVTLDLGQEQKVRKNSRVILYREGEPIIHPVTKKVLGTDTAILGEYRIREVFPQMSRAEVIREEKTPRLGDKAITK